MFGAKHPSAPALASRAVRHFPEGGQRAGPLAGAFGLVLTVVLLAKQPEALPLLRALCWGAGFVFLALATEATTRAQALSLAIAGLGMLTLAILSLRGGPGWLALGFLPLLLGWGSCAHRASSAAGALRSAPVQRAEGKLSRVSLNQVG